MKIVMLDLDGVLIINGVFSQAAIANLNDLLSKEPELKIVISSSWRSRGLDYAKDMLSKQGIDASRIIDITDLTHRDDRGHHIERYVQDHKNIEHFVILDDNADMDQVLDHLVQTNSYIGLTGSDIKLVLDILKKPC